jgi:hypothetical protein
MKTRNKLMLGAAFIAPLFLFVSVSAQANPQDRGAANQLAQTTTETTTQSTETEKKALLERLTKRKTDLKVRLTNTEKQRLQTRCKNATGQFSALNGRIKGIETSRTQVYENLISRLTGLSTKLQERGVDTTEFDAQVVELQEKITTFQTDLATYKQVVSDLEAMDCATDAEAFKASLEAARTARDKVKMDAQDIKAYVNETIKPTLKAIREQIVKEDGGESEDTTETQTTETNEGDQ